MSFELIFQKSPIDHSKQLFIFQLRLQTLPATPKENTKKTSTSLQHQRILLTYLSRLDYLRVLMVVTQATSGMLLKNRNRYLNYLAYCAKPFVHGNKFRASQGLSNLHMQ